MGDTTGSACSLLRATPPSRKKSRALPPAPELPDNPPGAEPWGEGWRPGRSPGVLLTSSRASGHPTATCPLTDRAQRGALAAACLGQLTKREALCQSSSWILLPCCFFSAKRSPTARRQDGTGLSSSTRGQAEKG